MSKGTTNSSKCTKRRFLEISYEEYKRLKYHRDNNSSSLIRDKCRAILLRAKWPSKRDDQIWTINNIKSVFEKSEKTIDRWISEYCKYGIKELVRSKYIPPKARLDDIQKQLCQDLDKGTYLTIDQIIDHVYKKYSISIGRTQMRKFLHKNGYAWRMTGHIPGKADPEKQKEWIETVYKPALDDSKNNGCHLYFSDAVHFILSEFCTHIWSRERRFLKSNTGRNRINIMGAVNAYTKKVVTINNTTYVDAEVVAYFLEKLRSLHIDNSKIYLVLDNAKYQHCQYVMDKAVSLNIELLFLPPYSPNLNIIERLWKFSKSKVLYGKFYETPKQFHDAIIDFFDTVNDKYQTDLERLLTLKFQLFDGSVFNSYVNAV